MSLTPEIQGSSPIWVQSTDATDTINQLTGTAWTVSDSTNPTTGNWILNTTDTSYTQVGSIRYYTVEFACDADNEMTFEVVGASDICSVSSIGYSLAASDFSSRMVYGYKRGKNVVSINRDDSTDVDILIIVNFIAFM